ncbi:hypothetical protein [Amycolatopsis sp. NPDC059657]|uniref:hypothetical protein n=1 Tax=Amycolatopsis sp. NPDC059657 TaxID=3346899 RepID=UPI00366C5A9C
MTPPTRVKALAGDLYALLSEMGTRDYEALIEAEYATPSDLVTHARSGDGLVSTITRPSRPTLLIYGGCTAAQIRQDLAARGLGSPPITWVPASAWSHEHPFRERSSP